MLQAVGGDYAQLTVIYAPHLSLLVAHLQLKLFSAIN